jgi:hypothetical protein
MISYKNHDIMYDIIVLAFLALMILATKSWYHTWYHGFSMISCMISQKPAFSSLSCATTLWFRLCYHIHITIFRLWYQQLMISAMISAMLWPCDIINSVYHSPLISQFFWYHVTILCFHSCYHGTCSTGWRCLWPPRASSSTSSCLAIAC